jgi:hypothetical protein
MFLYGACRLRYAIKTVCDEIGKGRDVMKKLEEISRMNPGHYSAARVVLAQGPC